jgi:hypothetical protein
VAERERGAFAVMLSSSWNGEWAWGNHATLESAESVAALFASSDHSYRRLLIDPRSRSGPPPGKWCIVWIPA